MDRCRHGGPFGKRALTLLFFFRHLVPSDRRKESGTKKGYGCSDHNDEAVHAAPVLTNGGTYRRPTWRCLSWVRIDAFWNASDV